MQGPARSAGATVHLISVEELGADAPAWATLDAADAIIFGAPTYMGSTSAKFKAFEEAASGRWFQQAWKDKFAARASPPPAATPATSSTPCRTWL